MIGAPAVRFRNTWTGIGGKREAVSTCCTNTHNDLELRSTGFWNTKHSEDFGRFSDCEIVPQSKNNFFFVSVAFYFLTFQLKIKMEYRLKYNIIKKSFKILMYKLITTRLNENKVHNEITIFHIRHLSPLNSVHFCPCSIFCKLLLSFIKIDHCAM